MAKIVSGVGSVYNRATYLKVGRSKSVLILIRHLYLSTLWLHVGLRMDAKSHVSKRDWTMCSNFVKYSRFNVQMLLHLKPDCSLVFFFSVLLHPQMQPTSKYTQEQLCALLERSFKATGWVAKPEKSSIHSQ